MRVGAHVPVAHGLVSALDYAVETGCECMQVFTKSPQQWVGPKRDPDEAAEFARLRAAAGIAPLFSHAAYLINVGSLDAVLHERSIEAVADELERAALVGADGVVLHMGTRAYEDLGRAAAYAAGTLRAGYERAQARCSPPPLVLENSAGAGTTFGSSLQELCAVAAALGDVTCARLCLDTCHAQAAGIPVSTPEDWAVIAEEIDQLVGLDRLALIHANDCMYEAGSRRDRHAWVGDGTIGMAGFAAMLAEVRLAHAAAIVEVPGEPVVKDTVNVGRLRELRDGGAGPSAPDPATS